MSNPYVFMHNPRTGGTTIHALIKTEHRGRACHRQWELEGKPREFSFCFVRNPWDRIVSRYLHDRKIVKNFKRTFERWLLGDNSHSLGLIHDLQIHFWRKADFVGRYENFAADWARLAERLNIEYSEIPHLNATEPRFKYREFYDDRSRRFVENIEASTIEKFGYDF